MPVIFLVISATLDGLVVGVGVPLADVYLELLGGRCRPNTALAAAYDLKVSPTGRGAWQSWTPERA
jgi:hypothetical protein